MGVECLFAQDLSNLREKTIQIDADTIALDTLSIIESGFIIKDAQGNVIPPEKYELLSVDAKLVWKGEPPTEPITFQYRTYPFLFNKKVFNRSYSTFKEKTDSEGFLIDASAGRSKTTTTQLVDFGRLTYSGNFSRGVSFGNAQSLNLNSNFNIQLAGMITDDIEVRAAITDNNIPIQPEGNTAQLQEFDKVYIQLRKDRHYLTVGDFDLQSPQSYFMKFQRNLQGVSYKGTQEITDVGELSAMGSFSVSRGQFVINNLTAQEGNQGPYKLTGPNGEVFIIVLAGSERVFINGELMQRGANNDYIIDYNLGEIVFTPNRLITQDLRIRVEFEYGDRYYFRSLAHANVEFDHKKFTTRINFFTQQDSKNQPINQELDEAREDALAAAGDDVSNAFFSGVSLQEFSENRVLYKKVDTAYNNIIDTIYVYSTNPEQAVYALSFTFVGEGNGHYVPIQSVANGRVFEWRQPLPDGTPQGNYEPLILLVAPQKSQLLTTALDYKLTENTIITGEFALSNYDINTFSDLDSDDNKGIGINLQINDVRQLKSDSLKTIKVNASYEYKQKTFTPLERYRAVEFNRNWNFEDDIARNENLGNAGIEFGKTGKGRVGYNFSFLQRDSVYDGFENSFYANYHHNGWVLNTNTIWLESKSIMQNTQFIRPKLSVQKAISALNDWSVGFLVNNEVNKIQSADSDSLLPASFLWQEYGVFIQNPDTARSMYRFEYKLRYQHLSDGEDSFDSPYMRANTFDFKGRVMGKKNHILNYNLIYRRLEQDTLFTSNDDLKNFYLGRIDYSFNAYKGAIRGSSLYEIGAGREQQIQYNYIEAPDGQGSYAWRDLNENGVQEINEFFVSAFQNENRFIRIAVSSPEFVPVTTTRFNQSLNLNPKSVWFDESGLKGFVARFSSTTALQFSQKVFASSAVSALDVFNPLSLNIDDSLLVSSNTSIRNVIFFNRTDTKYGFEYNYNFNNNKTLLTSGFERRELFTHIFKSRWNFVKTFTLNNQYTNGFRKNDSDFFFDRKYEYLLNEVLTNVTWLFKSVLRLELTHNYAFRTNPMAENGGQFAVINQFTTQAKYSIAGKSNLQVQFSYATVGYDDAGFRNEQLEFDMLQGYQNGSNYVWLASFDRTIAKNLQLSLVYDGRKTGVDAVVHTGRAQVRAVF
jgi:hypothetical protein